MNKPDKATQRARTKKIGRPFTLSREQELEALRLHVEEHESIRALARQFRCSATPIHTVLKRHDVLKPRTATAREKRIILRMGARRAKPQQVAAALERSLNFARIWMEKLGCGRMREPNETEKNRICSLYGQGYGLIRVMRATEIPRRWIRKTLSDHGISTHPGARKVH